MATVEIGANSYETYADVDAADEYLEAEFSANGTAWRAASDDDKARALVTSTRVLDRMQWLGDPAEDDQTLAWPRIDTNIDGVEDDEVPTDIVNASIELAAQIIAGTDALNQTQAQSVKSQKAGSVAIEYWRQFTTPSRLPLPVKELVSIYLSGSTGAISGISVSGVDECSDFAYGYEPGVGF